MRGGGVGTQCLRNVRQRGGARGAGEQKFCCFASSMHIKREITGGVSGDMLRMCQRIG